jgi:MFS family permease
MIVSGLILFGAGSAVAALSSTIDGVIIGRILQGAGAVGSVILALVADLTGEESRTQAMAVVGITIGGAFMFALIAGPVLAGLIGVPGIFWTMVGLALVGIAITEFVVPRPPALVIHRDTETVPSLLRSIAGEPGFRRVCAARDADREFSPGSRAASLQSRDRQPSSMDRLLAGASGLRGGDGAGHHHR